MKEDLGSSFLRVSQCPYSIEPGNQPSLLYTPGTGNRDFHCVTKGFPFPESAFKGEEKLVKGVQVLATTGKSSTDLARLWESRLLSIFFSTSVKELPINAAGVTPSQHEVNIGNNVFSTIKKTINHSVSLLN